MELTILERLMILNLDTLPKTGSILTMKIKQKLLNDVGFTEEEIKENNIKSDNGNVTWSVMAPPKEIGIGDEGIKLLIEAMDKSGNLSDNYVPLYDKLCKFAS